MRSGSSVLVRGEDQRPGRLGTGANDLVEPLFVVADQPHGSLHDGGRAAVVHLEVDPPQTREGLADGQHASNVGEPPP